METSAGSGSYQQYVFRSSDGGTSWDKTATGGTGSKTGEWYFDADEEGWTQETAGALLGWSSGDIYMYSPSGWTDGSWQYVFPVGSRPTAVTGQTFSVNITRGTNFFHNVRIYYTDGSWDGDSHNFAGTYTLTATVSAGNAGKSISYLYTGGLIHDSGGLASVHYALTTIPVNTLNVRSAFDVGQKDDANKVYASDGANVYRSTDGGITFGTYISGVSCVDLECHYNGNPLSQNLTIWRDTGELHRTAGATIGSVKLTESEAPNVRGRVVTYTNDEQVIYVLECTAVNTYRIRRTIDRGNVWVTGVTGITGARAIGLWPWGVHDAATQRVFWLDATHIRYSTDGGATQLDKTGDWGSFSNPVMIVPQWI